MATLQRGIAIERLDRLPGQVRRVSHVAAELFIKLVEHRLERTLEDRPGPVDQAGPAISRPPLPASRRIFRTSGVKLSDMTRVRRIPVDGRLRLVGSGPAWAVWPWHQHSVTAQLGRAQSARWTRARGWDACGRADWETARYV
jgi:hypothetical protein